MNVVPIAFASNFWATVEQCLIIFHNLDHIKAAEKVTSLWRRLPHSAGREDGEPSFDDMIYHGEPWYIACDLAGREIALEQYRPAYESLLRQIEESSASQFVSTFAAHPSRVADGSAPTPNAALAPEARERIVADLKKAVVTGTFRSWWPSWLSSFRGSSGG
jgi:hypothetical protein